MIVPTEGRLLDTSSRIIRGIPFEGGRAVKKAVLVVVGALLALMGLVWTLQGIGVVGGSPMTGVTLWAIVGPIVAVAGIVVAVLGLRLRRSAP
jgi:hypothetical protein